MPLARLQAFAPLFALLTLGAAPSASVAPEIETIADVAPSGTDVQGQETSAAGPWNARFAARLQALKAAADSAQPRRSRATHVPRAALERLARSLQDADVGISVRDLHSGEELFGWHPEDALNPASNQKLLTASAALELLGEDFRFETKLVRTKDTLYLVGGGDPSLQIEDLRALAATLDPAALEGIVRIAVDDTMFSEDRYGPGYDDAGAGVSYMAPSGALSLQFNTVEITVRPKAAGERPLVSVSPPCAHVEIHNRARTTRNGGHLQIRTAAEDDVTRIEIDGRVREGSAVQRERRRITDPAVFAGTAFARELAARLHTEALPVDRAPAPQGADLLAVHRSAPLPDVLVSALKFSNNFTSEQVLRTLGHLDSGLPGDWQNGGAVLRRFWAALAGDAEGLQFVNASGLSSHGRWNAQALTRLAELWADPSRPAHAILGALPVAGREGTLHDRLLKSKGRVRAKTGSLSGVNALTGVIASVDGTPSLGFSILVNGPVSAPRARRAQDQIVMALLEAQST